MAFEVARISRGDICLKDGVDEVRVLGEGLIHADKKHPNFVVYLNSFLMLDADGREKITESDKKAEIIAVCPNQGACLDLGHTNGSRS